MKSIYLTPLFIACSLSFSAPINAQPNQNNQMRYYTAPKPITENMLKQHLDAQLMLTKRQLAFDKKQADAYAVNFAQYQKRQATALKKMMDSAEQQRQYTIQVMEMQQHHIMQQFSKFQIASDRQK